MDRGIYIYIQSLTVRNVCYLSAGCCDEVRDRFARSANAPTTPTVRPHCPRVPSRANVCLLPTHTPSCPHTRHTCANYNILLYARSAGTYTYIYTTTTILYIVVRVYIGTAVGVGIHPVRANHPLLTGAADHVFWRAFSLCPYGNFTEILQPPGGG